MEKLLDFLQGESRRGFVHDDDSRVDGQRPSDRDQMLARHSEIAQPSVDVEMADADLAERLARLTRCRSPVDPAQAIARRVAEKDIFSHRQIVKEHRLLVDGGNPLCESVMSRRERHRAAIKHEGALRWLQDARHDLDERRFPSAVLANQSNDLARKEIQADAAQRAHAWKAFADVGEREARFARRSSQRVRHRRKPAPLSDRATPKDAIRSRQGNPSLPAARRGSSAQRRRHGVKEEFGANQIRTALRIFQCSICRRPGGSSGTCCSPLRSTYRRGGRS